MQQETTLGLVLTSLPGIAGVFLFYRTSYKKEAFYLLLLSAFLIRLLMISLDPFLQNWDERFHALVAKNMMEYPFKPMLIANPVFPYNYQEWWNSHIWVHKQPLFLWQMAASMKLFGVGTIALRLPMAIMGTAAVWMIREIAERWTKNEEVAFISALLVAVSWYSLEMTSGFLSLDHNDFTFFFYITAGIWAWSRYLDSPQPIKWAIWTGVFVGGAVLVKWLTAFLVLGGWGLYVLLSSERRSTLKNYLHIGIAGIVAVALFMPWQFYIMNRFPLEAAWSYAYNRQHIWDDLGHEGPWYFHFSMLTYAYQPVLVGFLIIGIGAMFFSKQVNTKLTLTYLAMILVLYGFFSFVATRMPGFVLPVSGLIFIFMSSGLYFLVSFLKKLPFQKIIIPFFLLFAGYLCMQPSKIIRHRYAWSEDRNRKIHHTAVYKSISTGITDNYVILNCPLHEQYELMFYKGGSAYPFMPEAKVLDSLQQTGYRFAAFQPSVEGELILLK